MRMRSIWPVVAPSRTCSSKEVEISSCIIADDISKILSLSYNYFCASCIIHFLIMNERVYCRCEMRARGPLSDPGTQAPGDGPCRRANILGGAVRT